MLALVFFGMKLYSILFFFLQKDINNTKINRNTDTLGSCYMLMACIITHYNRPANSHGSAVSLTIFCHFSRSHDKAPNLTGGGGKSF